MDYRNIKRVYCQLIHYKELLFQNDDINFGNLFYSKNASETFEQFSIETEINKRLINH